MSIRYFAFFSGPRWVDLEEILHDIANEYTIPITINDVETGLLSKKIFFTIFPKDSQVLGYFIQKLSSYEHR